jgi:hypothetical protein
LNIKSHEVKERIVKDLEERFGVKIVQRHHDRLENAAGLARLQKNPHMVCLRTNGNPYFMYLTRCNHVNQVIFIDKKIQTSYFVPRMIISKLRFDDDLFDDTLIDGEMITVKQPAGKWVFLAHDLIVLKGKRLDSDNVIKRIQSIHEILEKQFKPDVTDVCELQVKAYVPYDRIRYLVDELMPSLPYTCRGLYFKPLHLKFLDVLFNFDDSLIKKVERVKYQAHNDTFHENIADVAPSPPPEPAHPALPIPAPLSLPTPPESLAIDVNSQPARAPSSSPSVTPPTSSPTSANCTQMLIEKTHMVDVYIVYDAKTKKRAGYAAVTTLAMSKRLLSIFKSHGLHARVQMPCTYHEQFQKWLPML